MTEIKSMLDNFERYVLFETEDTIVMNKPAFITSVHGLGHPVSLNEILRLKRGPETSVCHRLDKETSGCIMAGKTKKGRAALCQAIHARQMEKRYLAVCEGEWPSNVVGVLKPLLTKNGKSTPATFEKESSTKRAFTNYSPALALKSKKGKTSTVLCVRIHTGKTHQIRVHASSCGFPLIGDNKYGAKPTGGGFLLHTHRLSVPALGIEVEAPVPVQIVKHVIRSKSITELGKKIITKECRSNTSMLYRVA